MKKQLLLGLIISMPFMSNGMDDIDKQVITELKKEFNQKVIDFKLNYVSNHEIEQHVNALQENRLQIIQFLRKTVDDGLAADLELLNNDRAQLDEMGTTERDIREKAIATKLVLLHMPLRIDGNNVSLRRELYHAPEVGYRRTRDECVNYFKTKLDIDCQELRKISDRIDKLESKIPQSATPMPLKEEAPASLALVPYQQPNNQNQPNFNPKPHGVGGFLKTLFLKKK